MIQFSLSWTHAQRKSIVAVSRIFLLYSPHSLSLFRFLIAKALIIPFINSEFILFYYTTSIRSFFTMAPVPTRSNCKLTFKGTKDWTVPTPPSEYPADWFPPQVENTTLTISNRELKKWLNSNPSCIPDMTWDKTTIN